MPPRFFENGAYYHIYNRGNRKQPIFLQTRDYERFLEKIVEYKKKFPLRIISYCLMPNHLHFLLQQLSSNSISQFLSILCNSHSRYFNVKYETVGSLFQGRFKAKRVDKDEYLIHVSRYIHLNPVELFSFANKEFLIKQLLIYRWSSLRCFLTGKTTDIVDPLPILKYFSTKDSVKDYRDFVISNIHLEANPLIDHLVFDED